MIQSIRFEDILRSNKLRSNFLKFSCHTAKNNNKHLTLTADLLQVGHLTIHQRFAVSYMQRVQLTQSRPVAAFFSLSVFMFCLFFLFFGPTLFYILMCRRCFTFSCADACHSGIFRMPPPSAPIADT